MVAHHTVTVEDGELPLVVARAGGVGAGVVIVPSAFGVGADLEAQMQEVAAEASLVVAIDPFFREGGGVVPYDDMARVMGRLRGLDRGRAYRDLGAAIDWARGRAERRAVVVLGICFGGSLALLAAADGAADGVVTWHGARMETVLDRAAEMRCPLRLHFGGADPFVPAEVVEAVRAAFGGRRDVEIAVHDGATHGFSHRASARSYQERAERAGMDALRALVAAVGGAGVH